jgi:outer membrane protein
MQYLKHILLFCFIGYSFNAIGQDTNTLTLQQALDIAIKSNLTVKQNELTMETDRVNFVQAKENLLPNINADVNHGYSNGHIINTFTNTYVNQSQKSATYSLSGSLNLFSGFSYLNAIKQTSLAYQAGKMDFQQAKDLVTINVITAYLLVLDNQEQLVQLNNQVEVSRRQVERLGILNKEGSIKPSDLSDLQGTLDGNQVNVVNAKNTLETSKLNLLQIMNIPYTKELELQPLNAEELKGAYGTSAQQIYDTALQQLALVKAATLRRESAEKGVIVAKGALLPSITLSGGFSTNYSSADQKSVFVDSTVVPTGNYINTPTGKQSVYTNQQNYTSQNISYADQLKNNYATQVSIGLHIPILNYFQKRNNVSIAKINLLNLKYIEENTKIQLRQNVQQAYLNMTSAYERYQILSDQVKAYKESFRIAEIRFNAGAITSVDFVVAKNNLDGANLNLISARYDYFITSKILDYYQGKLTSFQ